MQQQASRNALASRVGGWLVAALAVAGTVGANEPAAVQESRYLTLTAGPGGAFEIIDKATGVRWQARALSATNTAPAHVSLSIQRGGRTVVLENHDTNDVVAVARGFFFTDVDHGLFLTSVNGGAGSSIDANVKQPTSDLINGRLQMMAAQKRGSALLVSWNDPYVETRLERWRLTEAERTDLQAHDEFYRTNQPTAANGLSVTLQHSTRRLEFTPVGKGDFVKAAKEYRQILIERGQFVTLREKAKSAPSTERLIGAPYLRMWANKAYPHPQSLKAAYLSACGMLAPGKLALGPSFDDIGSLVRHFKDDLGFRRGHVLMTGWQNMGYDRKLPDVLPTAPEAGGDTAMARLSQTVRDAGYTLGFHDDYVIAFSEAKSFDPADAVTNQLANAWFGGPQWECCPQRKLKYAQRNVSQIHRLFHLNAYHLDIEMAGLAAECTNPAHPSDKRQHLIAKRDLCRAVSKLTGPVGSEEGMEFGIADFAYFENWPSYSGPPLGELVFRECMQFYELYNAQRYVKENDGIFACLREIAHGRMFTFPAGTFCEFYKVMKPINGRYGDYLAQDPADMQPVPKDNYFGRSDNGWGQDLKRPWDVWMKNLYEVESPLNKETAHVQMTNFIEGPGWLRSTFADDTEVIVEIGGQPMGSRMANTPLPALGFIVNGPRFQAFHATEWNGLRYDTAPLFTVRSLDGRPIERSTRLRVYHGFGPATIALRTQRQWARVAGQRLPVRDGILRLDVPRETVIQLE